MKNVIEALSPDIPEMKIPIERITGVFKPTVKKAWERFAGKINFHTPENFQNRIGEELSSEEEIEIRIIFEEFLKVIMSHVKMERKFSHSGDVVQVVLVTEAEIFGLGDEGYFISHGAFPEAVKK